MSPTIVIASHAWYHEQIGGSFKIATEMAEELARRAYRVCFVCSSQELALPAGSIIDRGVELWRYPFPENAGALGRIRQHLQHSRRLIEKIAADTQIECLVGHSPLQHFGAMRSSVKPRRLAYCVHSPFVEELQSHALSRHGRTTFKSRLAGVLAYWIERQNVAQADVVQTDSQFTSDVLARRYPRQTSGKLSVSPGWVDTQKFQPANATTRDALGESWQTDVPTFFTLRRLEPRMGLDALVEAARKLKDRELPFRLMIGGGGSLHGQLADLIRQLDLADSVHLLGRLSDEDVCRCYAAADCFVLPTRSLECFGLIILEAYASGTPVIATRAAAIPEIVKQHGEEWLVDDCAAELIAAKMSQFLQGELRTDVDDVRRIAKRYEAPECLDRLIKTCLKPDE